MQRPFAYRWEPEHTRLIAAHAVSALLAIFFFGFVHWDERQFILVVLAFFAFTVIVIARSTQLFYRQLPRGRRRCKRA